MVVYGKKEFLKKLLLVVLGEKILELRVEYEG